MSKKTTTLYLDKTVVERCRELNINISDTVNKILRLLLENPTTHEEEILLNILLTEKEKILRDIEDLKSQTEKSNERLNYLNVRIERQKGLVKEVHRSDEIAFLMRSLNAKIREFDFDIKKIQPHVVEIQNRLKTLGMDISRMDWLERQIERVKRLSV